MNYTLIYTPAYNKRAKKFIKAHAELAGQYAKTLKILEINPLHNSLRLHPLRGKLTGLHSVSINMQYRITLELIIKNDQILLVNVGDHGTVY